MSYDATIHLTLRRGLLTLILAPLVACGGGDGTERSESRDRPGEEVRETTPAEAEGDRETVRVGEQTTIRTPDSPKETVIALIEAYRAGDRERVDELSPDLRGRRHDEEAFAERVDHYRELEFDLRPEAIGEYEFGGGTYRVAVPATDEDGQEWNYVFNVRESDGGFEAGEPEAQVPGVP